MRSSTIITVLCAALATATPIVRKDLVKKDLVTEVVTDTVYVTVTEDPSSETSVKTIHTTVVTIEVYPTAASTSSTPPPPPPTTTKPPPPPPTTTPKPPPPPPTTKAPPPPPQTTEAAPAPTSEAPVVVQSPAPSPSPAVATNSNAGLPSGSDYISTVLYHHNIHRRNHSAPDATYDNTIAGYAAQVASSCHYAHDLTPGGGGYGQNIAAYGSTENPASIGAAQSAAGAITNMWYDGEVELFLPSYYGEDNPDMSNFESWGHFSQVVWSGSTGVGCASQLCDAGKIFDMPTWFTVCNYSPAGNMGGAYGSNVNPPLGHDNVVV